MAIKPSMTLTMLLLLSHAIVASVVYVTLLPLGVKLVILTWILLSLFFYLARDALLLLPGSWREISIGQGSVSVVTHRGSDLSGQIIGSTTVSPYFAVLRVMLPGHRLPVSRTIFPDSLDTGEYRELCVRLKFSQ